MAIVFPFTLVNATLADANQVMANLNALKEAIEGVSAAAAGTDTYQAGAVSTTDWTSGCTIVGGTGVLTWTSAGGAAWLPGPVSGLVRTFTTAQAWTGLKPPVLPGPGGYLNVGIELTASGAAATVSVVSGAEQGSEALALANPPAVSAGKVRARNVVILNTAGTYSIVKEVDQRPWATGGGAAGTFLPGTVPVGALARAHTSIATEQSRENVVYGTLPTPDEVTLTLPENGLIVVGYEATWKNTTALAGKAAIFLGANQLKVAGTEAAPATQEAVGANSTVFRPLATSIGGLASGTGVTEYTGDVTTGQIVGQTSTTAGNGPTMIFAAAGTYAVSVRFLAAAGSVVVKNRKLWVEARAF